MRYLIYGDAEAGKTTTCHNILKALLSFGARLIRYEDISYGDFTAILNFHEVKVAIYSAGDDNRHLKAALAMANDYGCDILVATVRSYVKYRDPLSPYTEGIDYEWRTLSNSSTKTEQVRLCNAMALDIISEINKLIK